MGNRHRKKQKERRVGRKLADQAWEAVDRSDVKRAEETLRHALKHREGDCVLWNDLGLILWRRDKLREAEKAFRNAIFLRPDYEVGKMNLALLLEAQGFYRQALAVEEDLALSSPRAEYHRQKAAELRTLAEARSEQEKSEGESKETGAS